MTYQFYDENTAGRMVTFGDLAHCAENVDALFFGGISLATEPCGSAYEAFMQSYSTEKLIMLDPNVRPQFVKDAASYRLRLQRLFGIANTVKVSDEDLHRIDDSSRPIVEKVVQLLKQGPDVVVLTKRASGMTIYLANGSSGVVDAEPVDVVDTAGAGDSFNTGFLARLTEFGARTPSKMREVTIDQVRNAAMFGAKVAAFTVSRAGANPAWKSEIMA